jgi:hypothetical protein
MPVWYILVYTSTSQYENLIPIYTGIYFNVRNHLVLSRWWRFQMYQRSDLRYQRLARFQMSNLNTAAAQVTTNVSYGPLSAGLMFKFDSMSVSLEAGSQ